jgi:hypothetical protein
MNWASVSFQGISTSAFQDITISLLPGTLLLKVLCQS